MSDFIGLSNTGSQTETYKQNKYPQITRTMYGLESDVRYSGSRYWGQGWDVEFERGESLFKGTFSVSGEVDSGNNIIQYGSGSYITLNWNMVFKTTEKELLHCSQNEIAWIDQVTLAEKSILETALSDPPKDGSYPLHLYSSASYVVWNMAKFGFRTVPVSVPVFRMTLTVPATYNLGNYYTNLYPIPSVYTLSTLASTLGIPSNWTAVMPQGTDPSTTTTNGIPMHYGWKKNPPDVQENGAFMTVQQDWEYGLWPQNIYGVSL
jgi:hypothetical protein